MKKIIYVIMFLIFLTIPSFAKAEEIYYWCENSYLTKIQKLASNVVYTYDYVETFNENEQFGNVTFNVTISNLSDKLYLKNMNTKETYYSSDELVITDVKPGETLKYQIYSNGYGCHDRNLITLYVNVPHYNKYYKDDLCKKNKDHKLCGKWTYVDKTYEEFKKILSPKDENIKEEVKVEEKTFEEKFAELIDYLDRNKLPIFGSIIIITLTLITFLKITDKKNEFDLK